MQTEVSETTVSEWHQCHISTLFLNKHGHCPSWLVVMASCLETNMSSFGPTRRPAVAGQDRGIHVGPEETRLRRFCTCPVCKRNKFIEQSMLKPSRRGADIQISATECSVLAVLQALISAHGYQLHCWAAWMVSGRKKKPWYLLFLRIFLIFSDQKNQPSCPVSAFCPRLTLNPDRSSCLIFIRLSRNSWNYL